MSNLIIVDQDLQVQIDRLIQLSTPDVFSDCSTTEEINQTSTYFSEMIKQEFKMENIYIINPLMCTNKKIASVMTLSCNKPFGNYDNFHYLLNVLWFQEEYSFPISADTIQALKNIPFKRIAKKEKNPF